MAKDPYEQAINPSFGQQLLEGLIAAASNLGQPGSGITLLDIMKNARQERAMTDLLQKIGAGPQVAGPPTPPNAVAQNLFNAGAPPSDIFARFNPQAAADNTGRFQDFGGPPRATSEMERQFTMENLFKIASLPGADVNKAMQFLQTTGKLQSPQERLLAQKTEADLKRDAARFESIKEKDKRGAELRKELETLKTQARKSEIILRQTVQANKSLDPIRIGDSRLKQIESLEKGWEGEYNDYEKAFLRQGRSEEIIPYQSWKISNGKTLPSQLESDETYRDYLENLRTGRKLQSPPIPQPGAQKSYKSPDEVKAAVSSGVLSRDAGLAILEKQFGFKRKK